MRRTASIVIVLLVGGSSSCIRTGSSISRERAKEVADAFMADVVKDDVASAVSRMEPALFKLVGRPEAEAGIRSLFDDCGRPVESEFRHDEVGFKVYLDGSRKPMRKFYYVGATTAHPRGNCFFAVEVVPEGDGMAVTSCGPLKLQWGSLPDWAK